jgi:hypothetical protein
MERAITRSTRPRPHKQSGIAPLPPLNCIAMQVGEVGQVGLLTLFIPLETNQKNTSENQDTTTRHVKGANRQGS